eukprot:CAMPEP_0177794168 /NCGR_PEP_ID=MMETSP0491_2-20121128/25495_1 /TAXON_ID=63592 /ORGANISM="Tetraselmis chuii, Strain PLY429" /LENGTH=136 /DNA_ID=CAMNT_0019316793 /DNA_START=328 /DNA_END=735 /DNA_ORIENTATION=+
MGGAPSTLMTSHVLLQMSLPFRRLRRLLPQRLHDRVDPRPPRPVACVVETRSKLADVLPFAPVDEGVHVAGLLHRGAVDDGRPAEGRSRLPRKWRHHVVCLVEAAHSEIAQRAYHARVVGVGVATFGRRKARDTGW